MLSVCRRLGRPWGGVKVEAVGEFYGSPRHVASGAGRKTESSTVVPDQVSATPTAAPAADQPTSLSALPLPPSLAPAAPYPRRILPKPPAPAVFGQRMNDIVLRARHARKAR